MRHSFEPIEPMAMPFSWRRLVHAAMQTTTALGLTALVVGNLTCAIYFDRQKANELDAAHIDASNLNTAFEQHIVRAIQNIDQALLVARAEIEREPDRLTAQDLAKRDYFPKDLAIQLALIGADGWMRSSNLQSSGAVDLNDREHFRVHADTPKDELFISKPVLGRVSQVWTIQFTRKLRDAQGQFAGVLVASLDPNILSRLYNSIDIGKSGAITLFGLDGVVRARSGMTPDVLGRTLNTQAITQALNGVMAGSYENESVIDGVARLVSFRKLTDYPLIVTVALGKDEVLAEYERSKTLMWRIVLAIDLLLILIMGLGTLEKYRLDETRDLLRVARDRAEAASRARTAFLATMSHEIRTPLSGIVSMADLMATTSLDALQRRYVEVTRDSAEHLLELLSDVLDVTKLDAEQVKLEHIRFDLFRQLRSTLDIVSIKALEKGLPIGCLVRPDVPREIFGDPGRLRQILINLLSNAIKFTQNGHVLLEVSRLTHEGSDVLHLRIEDTGIGIAPEDQKNLFRDFSQIDSSISRRFGGTGLGLAISSKLVARMGGAIEVKSKLGQGSVFSFHIPLVQFEEPAPLPQTSMAVAIASRKSFERGLYAQQLQPAFHDLRAFDNLAAAQDWLAHFPADKRKILLADLSVVSEGAPSFEGRDVEAFLLCARQDFLAQEHALQKSFVGLVQTPIFLDELHASLARPIIRATDGQVSNPVGAPLFPLADKLKGLKVLLAEDNVTNQFALSRMLENMGAQVTSVKNGQEAIDAARQEKFDCVVMDVMMPEMDGLSAARGIRALNVPWHRLPMVALTASAFAEDRDAAFAAGMNGFATKPITARRLLDAIEACVQSQQADLSEDRGVVADHPILDRALLEQLTQDLGPQHLAKALQVFFEDLRRRLAVLQAGGSNLDVMRREAHAIKGSAASFGFSRVAYAAELLEQAARRGEASQVDALKSALACAVEAAPDPMAKHH